jgi:hypothetical protein
VVTGILNGMDEGERAFPVPTDLDAFFEAKRQAKLAFQVSCPLPVALEAAGLLQLAP